MDSRIETLLKALLNGDSVEDFIPQSRAEAYLKSCILKEGVSDLPDPQSRLDALLYELAETMPTLGSGDIQLQTKTATPGVNEVVIRPDTGYALSKVTIEAVTSAIDANIKAENIKAGISILNVQGTEKGYDVGYTEGEAAGRKSGYNEGFEAGVEKATLPSQEKIVDPSVETQTVEPDEGKTLSKVTVKPVTSDIDANIKPENIVVGTTILGVEGSNLGAEKALYYASSLNGTFYGVSFPEKSKITIHLKKPVDCYQTFANTRNLTEIKIITDDKESPFSLKQTFRAPESGDYTTNDIVTVDLTDCSRKLVNIDYLFLKASNLKNVYGDLDLSECTSAMYSFHATSLETVRFVPDTIKCNIAFGSSSLSTDSIQSIIDGLAKTDTLLQLDLAGNIVTGLSESQNEAILLKNWQVI